MSETEFEPEPVSEEDAAAAYEAFREDPITPLPPDGRGAKVAEEPGGTDEEPE